MAPTRSDSVFAWQPVTVGDRAIFKLRDGSESTGILVGGTDSLLFVDSRARARHRARGAGADTLDREGIRSVIISVDHEDPFATALAFPFGVVFGFLAGVGIAALWLAGQ